ncbi:hypothetical protein ALC53_11992, partial [Atta colombica]
PFFEETYYHPLYFVLIKRVDTYKKYKVRISHARNVWKLPLDIKMDEQIEEINYYDNK